MSAHQQQAPDPVRSNLELAHWLAMEFRGLSGDWISDGNEAIYALINDVVRPDLSIGEIEGNLRKAMSLANQPGAGVSDGPNWLVRRDSARLRRNFAGLYSLVVLALIDRTGCAPLRAAGSAAAIMLTKLCVLLSSADLKLGLAPSGGLLH